MKQGVSVFVTGVAMGAANVVPGVSGGTVALIAGIYERLIGAIRAFDLEAARLLWQRRFAECWRHVDGRWLTLLIGGIVISIVSLARLFEYLLDHHERLTMAFFFGLILLSVVYVGRSVQRWTPAPVLALVAGTAVAITIALLAPASEDGSPFYVFLCGVVAISSMVLPGLSGSFVLILMGNYALVLGAINRFEFGVLIPLAAGCAIGLVAFSHLLGWVFRHYERVTLATMTGFVVGSLVVIWPWKTARKDVIGATPEARREIVVGYDWYWPDATAGDTWLAIAMMLFGMACIAVMEYSAGLRSRQAH